MSMCVYLFVVAPMCLGIVLPNLQKSAIFFRDRVTISGVSG
jgi:hypothetical protein